MNKQEEFQKLLLVDKSEVVAMGSLVRESVGPFHRGFKKTRLKWPIR